MYLESTYEGRNEIPRLVFDRNTEQQLLDFFYRFFPFHAINAKYGLDLNTGNRWSQHLRSDVLNSVAYVDFESVLKLNTILFKNWMTSGHDQSLFYRVRLKDFLDDGLSSQQILTLVPDLYCLACESQEPAPLFLGTTSSPYKFYEQYKHLHDAIRGDSTILEQEYIDNEGCFVCKPNDYPVTPNMLRLAHSRPGICECVPCRGRL